MKRLLFAAILLVASVAGAGDFITFPSFPTRGQGPFDKGAWWQSGLTFHAPFTDPNNPLYLAKGTGALSFTRATTAMRTAIDNGYLTVTPSGTLRIESNGALIEGQRTNLVFYSEQLGLAANWAATNVTVDNNTVQAPTGDNTAETLTATDANGSVLSSITGTVAAYTFSAYLKRKTGTGDVSVSADNTTGTVCTINASTWTRCADTATLTVAPYTPGIHIVTSGDAVYAFGGDAELGAFASSYIPTTTAAVTRNADDLSIAASGNISGTVGTASATVTISDVTTGATQVALNNSHGATRLPIYHTSSNRLALHDGASRVGPVWNTTASAKVATSWTGTTALLCKDGAASTSATFDGNMDVGTTIHIGKLYDGTLPLFGNIKSLRIWSRAFTDAELQTISQ